MSRPPTLPAKKLTILPSAIAVAAAVWVIPAGAQAQPAPYAVIESGRSYQTLQQAVDAIGDSRGTIAIAPGSHADCAVQAGGIVSYLATEPGAAIFDGAQCEGHPVLVLRGHGAEVSGLVFENIRAPSASAIRLEAGDLTVAESWFRDSVQGIVTGDALGGRIMIDRTTFSRLGPCEAPESCGHSITTGAYAQLRITRSRFEGGRGSGYVRSQAAQVDIASSSFDLAAANGAGAMIAVAEGASGQISNNWFVQDYREGIGPAVVASIDSGGEPGGALLVTGNSARLATAAAGQVAALAEGDARTDRETGENTPGADGS